MKKIFLYFILTILCISAPGISARQTQQTQSMSTQATLLPGGSPSISMVGNTMIISGNGHALNTADLSAIISANNDQGVDTYLVSAPGTVLEKSDYINTTIRVDSSDNVVIRNNNFMNHFSNGTSNSRNIVEVTNSNNITIVNNVFNNITYIYTNGFDLFGIYLETVQGATIHNNTFSNFSAQGMHTAAVYGWTVSSASVDNNTITDNTASLGIDGIWLEESNNNYVANNIINNLRTTSGKAEALEVYAGMNNVFDQNMISNIYANQSQAYGYYFGQTDQIRIMQTTAYHSSSSDFTANLSGMSYADIQFWQTNHTAISTLHTMNFTVIDYSTYDYFNYSKNDILQSEGIWNNNMTTFDIIPSAAVDQHQLLFGSTAPSIYVFNTTVFTESVAPVILSSSVQEGSISIQENGSISFTWSLSDSFPGNYVVYLNDTSVASGNWENSVVINYSFSGFAVGTYNLTAEFSDMFANSVTFHVEIIVNAVVSSTSGTPSFTSSSITTTTTSTTTSSTTNTKIGETSSSAGGFLPVSIMTIVLSIASIGILRKQKYH